MAGTGRAASATRRHGLPQETHEEQRSQLKALEALVATGARRNDSQHVEAHSLRQRPAARRNTTHRQPITKLFPERTLEEEQFLHKRAITEPKRALTKLEKLTMACRPFSWESGPQHPHAQPPVWTPTHHAAANPELAAQMCQTAEQNQALWQVWHRKHNAALPAEAHTTQTEAKRNLLDVTME